MLHVLEPLEVHLSRVNFVKNNTPYPACGEAECWMGGSNVYPLPSKVIHCHYLLKTNSVYCTSHSKLSVDHSIAEMIGEGFSPLNRVIHG
ncbi:hypothetical protein Dd1591_1763 [Dickeya chrysanthemi Ech1591]|uniref:Uncharacterized protein n=1 Tax=Dickeya chrysanthemi (strain Ech1591) TaxID=561229 RepID=C6CG45_DICC1|nr:hypothetical protein Dd1591_1763 [Dickeya chrysanthemi Ech1591]